MDGLALKIDAEIKSDKPKGNAWLSISSMRTCLPCVPSGKVKPLL